MLENVTSWMKSHAMHVVIGVFVIVVALVVAVLAVSGVFAPDYEMPNMAMAQASSKKLEDGDAEKEDPTEEKDSEENIGEADGGLRRGIPPLPRRRPITLRMREAIRPIPPPPQDGRLQAMEDQRDPAKMRGRRRLNQPMDPSRRPSTMIRLSMSRPMNLLSRSPLLKIPLRPINRRTLLRRNRITWPRGFRSAIEVEALTAKRSRLRRDAGRLPLPSIPIHRHCAARRLFRPFCGVIISVDAGVPASGFSACRLGGNARAACRAG